MILTNKPMNALSEIMGIRDDGVMIYGTPGSSKMTLVHIMSSEGHSEEEIDKFVKEYDKVMEPYFIPLKEDDSLNKRVDGVMMVVNNKDPLINRYGSKGVIASINPEDGHNEKDPSDNVVKLCPHVGRSPEITMGKVELK